MKECIKTAPPVEQGQYLHTEEKALPVGGFQKQSLVDYPGHISSIVFTSGCNMRCNYCHNPELVLPEQIKTTRQQNAGDILKWIHTNKLLLDAVVITGGEPTLHPALVPFIRQIKQYGLKIKLDTNGTNPLLLQRLIDDQLVDYVAMDIKAPLETHKYQMIVGRHFNDTMMEHVKQSIYILTAGAVHYEFRTTVDAMLNDEDIQTIIHSIKGNFYLQQVNTNHKTLSGKGLNILKYNLHAFINNHCSHTNVIIRGD
jgi:pyruvate formate lyase activating enzyme